MLDISGSDFGRVLACADDLIDASQFRAVCGNDYFSRWFFSTPGPIVRYSVVNTRPGPRCPASVDAA
jgi:hypothetical protein